mgnify:CR=1 FL=1
MKEYKFNDIYELVSLIDRSVRYGESFWNYNEEIFIKSSSNFSKFTLLHLYIITSAFNYHSRKIRKNCDYMDGEEVERWMSLFETYGVQIEPYDIPDEEEPYNWLEENSEKFEELFSAMADEAFHILFYNRNFLLEFNRLVAETIKETGYPDELLTRKGRLQRAKVPEWLKTAVFHRDKGRCVYCNTDLTSLVNTINQKNFDHMVPLDIFGSNDPCNIQLTCESCNKSKSNKGSSTSFRYPPWWN